MQSTKKANSSTSSRRLFEIDKDIEKRLTGFAKIGLGFKPAVERLHAAPRTIIRAAARQGKLDWLCKLFPASEKTIRRDVGADSVQELQVRALTKSWRPPKTKKTATSAY